MRWKTAIGPTSTGDVRLISKILGKLGEIRIPHRDALCVANTVFGSEQQRIIRAFMLGSGSVNYGPQYSDQRVGHCEHQNVMSVYTFQPESSILEQVFRGFVTGFRWFFRLLVTVAVFVILGTLLFKVGSADSGESDQAVETHRDIRRNIAFGVGGPGTMHGSAPLVALVEPWKPLDPSVALLADDSGFESRVEIRTVSDGVDFRVIFGPYDPEMSQGFRESFGWVTLKLLQANGLPFPGLEGGFKIQLSSFEFHQEGGLPVGWIYRGSLGKGFRKSVSDISAFELGWVIPSKASTHQSVRVVRR